MSQFLICVFKNDKMVTLQNMSHHSFIKNKIDILLVKLSKLLKIK